MKLSTKRKAYEIKNYGRIVICRVYADWSCNETLTWRTKSKDYGIEPIQCDRISGKNSTDIKIVVDIMETLHTIDYISLYYVQNVTNVQLIWINCHIPVICPADI